MAGSFSVRFPSPGTNAGSVFMDSYNRARTLQLAEDRAALQMFLTKRALDQEAAGERAAGAVWGAPDEPLTLAPPRTMAGPVVAPAAPGGVIQDPGGLTEFGPPSAPVSAVEGQAIEAPAPYSLAGAPSLAVPPTPEVRGPDIQEPAITEPGVTLAGIRKSLAGDPRALAALGHPSVQQAMKARGVLSDNELRYREGLALAGRESKDFMAKIPDLMREGDSLGATMAAHSYYQRLADLWARKDPAVAEQNRRHAHQLFLQAVRLREDAKERGLADTAAEKIQGAVDAFMKPGGNTPEHFSDILTVLGSQKGTWARGQYQNFLQHHLQAALTKLPDPEYRAFYEAVVADQQRQMQDHGTVNHAQSWRAAARQYPNVVPRMASDKGADGTMAREMLFPGRKVTQGSFASTLRAVQDAAAAKGEQIDDLEAHRRAHSLIKQNLGAEAREGDRGRRSDRRVELDAMKTELGTVKDDILRLGKEQNSRNLTRDPALVQKDIDAKIKRRDELVKTIKDRAASAGVNATDDDEDEEDDTAPTSPATPGIKAPAAKAPAAAPAAKGPTTTPLTGPALKAKVAELAAAELKRRGKTADDAKRDPNLQQSVYEAVLRQIGTQ